MEYQVAPAAPTRANDVPIIKRMLASFNIDKVIRSVETEDGKLIVILDDFHEEKKQAIRHNSNGKPVPFVETQMLQSEIHLNEEDKIRFRKISEIIALNWESINSIPVITTDGI